MNINNRTHLIVNHCETPMMSDKNKTQKKSGNNSKTTTTTTTAAAAVNQPSKLMSIKTLLEEGNKLNPDSFYKTLHSSPQMSGHSHTLVVESPSDVVYLPKSLLSQFQIHYCLEFFSENSSLHLVPVEFIHSSSSLKRTPTPATVFTKKKRVTIPKKTILCNEDDTNEDDSDDEEDDNHEDENPNHKNENEKKEKEIDHQKTTTTTLENHHSIILSDDESYSRHSLLLEEEEKEEQHSVKPVVIHMTNSEYLMHNVLSFYRMDGLSLILIHVIVRDSNKDLIRNHLTGNKNSRSSSLSFQAILTVFLIEYFKKHIKIQREEKEEEEEEDLLIVHDSSTLGESKLSPLYKESLKESILIPVQSLLTKRKVSEYTDALCKICEIEGTSFVPSLSSFSSPLKKKKKFNHSPSLKYKR